jgi:hypothetical protein
MARGIFTSTSDLARKLRRYINAYSANARPFQWKYSDPTRRIRSNELSATGHYSTTDSRRRYVKTKIAVRSRRTLWQSAS